MTADGEAWEYSTSQLAAAAGYSVQQVRDLERLGVIPAARRKPNGYRAFEPLHIHALQVYRSLAVAIGPVPARSALQRLYHLPSGEAAALVGSWHIELARERTEALAGVRMLDIISAEARGIAATDVEGAMTITELANALGLRASTLRFWEQAGLVTPERVTRMKVRRYPQGAIRAARITAALRAAGYGIPELQNLMESWSDARAAGDLDAARARLQGRLDTIGGRMWALVRAGGDIAGLLSGPTDPTDPTTPRDCLGG